MGTLDVCVCVCIYTINSFPNVVFLLRILIGVTEKTSAVGVSELLNSTGVDLLLSGALRSKSMTATDRAQTVQQLLSSHNQTQLAWNIGDRKAGHLATLVGPHMVNFNQMLLLTLPGTPVFNYGDEIALADVVSRDFP